MTYYYGTAWRRLRRAKLKATPFCEECERFGKTTIATMVHHILPCEEHPDKLLANDNLCSICSVCHYWVHLDRYKHPSKKERWNDAISA